MHDIQIIWDLYESGEFIESGWFVESDGIIIAGPFETYDTAKTHATKL